MAEPGVIERPDRRRLLRACFSGLAPSRGLKEFKPVDAVAKQAQGIIWAIDASDTDNIFLAGDDGTIFHYDGNTWRREAFPSDLPVHTLCRGTDSTLFAAGWLGLIAARRKGEWQILQGGNQVSDNDNPEIVRINLPLFDLACAADGSIWAAGDQGRVVRSDGDIWEEIDCGSSVNLRCILPLDDNSIMVAGLGGTVLHYRDGRWENSNTQTNCPIVSMVAVGAEEILAVGGEYDAATGGFVGRVFQYDGEVWSELETGQSLPRLRRIQRDKDELLIVGDGGFATRINRQGAQRLHTNILHDLHNVAILERGSSLVCGDGGTVMLESMDSNSEAAIESPAGSASSSSWKNISPGITKKSLRGVWCAHSKLIYAVGDAGTAIKYDGQDWTSENIPVNNRLHGIWGASPNNIYVIGDNATILHFDGDAWSVCYKGEVDVAFLAITGFGAHDIFVVGDNGTALRFDGVNWQRMETGTQYELYAIWGFDAEHVLAVGGAGIVLRWNGEQWQLFNAGTDNDLYGVWGESLERIYFCGLSGTLIEYNGRSWNKQFTGSRNDLHAISCSSGEPVFAAGSRGCILQRKGNQWQTLDSNTSDSLYALALADEVAIAVGSNGCIVLGETA